MGAEARCTARFRGAAASGTARLETAALQFRGGELRVSILFAAIRNMHVADGVLSVDTTDGDLSLDLGPAAERWMDKIRHPPSRLQKLGVKPEWRVSVIGIDDGSFVQEIAAVAARLSVGRVIKESDAIFFGANRANELTRIRRLKPALKQNGAYGLCVRRVVPGFPNAPSWQQEKRRGSWTSKWSAFPPRILPRSSPFRVRSGHRDL